MGVFQKVNEWLAEKGEKIARGGDAGRTANNAYYASQESQQVFGNAAGSAQDAQAAGSDTARNIPADRFRGDAGDKYGGRVPYKSQKDMQAEAESQRQQAEDQQRRQMTAPQQKPQQFGRAPAQNGYGQPVQAQQGNVVPFPGMIRGPEGNYYAHVEYVVLLRSRNECTKVIEYIKANASVFLNMEFIANDSERQRCVDMLSGAAYTLGCTLSKISQRGIYLISSPSVYVVIDPAMQKFAAAPESQGYVRPEYGSPANYGAAAQGYAAQPAQGYGAPAGNYAQPVMGARTAAYAQQSGHAAAQPNAAYAAQGTERFAAQPAGSYTAATERYPAQNAAAYAAQGAHTSAYAAPYPAQPAAPYGGQTPGNQAGGYGAGAPSAAYPPQRDGYATAGGMDAPASGAPQRRAGAPFGMQGPFVKSAEGGQAR